MAYRYIENEGDALAAWGGYLNPSFYMVALWAANGWPTIFVTDSVESAVRQWADWKEMGQTSIRKGGILIGPAEVNTNWRVLPA